MECIHSSLSGMEVMDVDEPHDNIFSLDLQIQHILDDDDGDSMKSLCRSLLQLGDESQRLAPLVKVFCYGNSFGGDWHVQRVGRVARTLMERFPHLLHANSATTGCSPLHAALRNYGNVPHLIRMLIEADLDHQALRHVNFFGDLPLHVACTVGVPVNVLRLVLSHTLVARKSKEPHFLVWSVNHAGYTPADLEWIRHLEQGSGFDTHRRYYPLPPAGVSNPGSRQQDLYCSLLQRAVEQVMAATMDDDAAVGLLLHRIFLIVRVSFGDSLTTSPVDLAGDILHKASALSGPFGPTLPLPLLELLLWRYPEQLTAKDHQSKYPLHYACTWYKSTTQISARTLDAWSTWIQRLVERAPKVLHYRDAHGRLPLHYALAPGTTPTVGSKDVFCTRDTVVRCLVERDPSSLSVRDPVTGLLPFHMAAANEQLSLKTTHWILREYPSAIHYT